ncbi:MAG: hypothetical protein WKG07_48965 [Hymenobacter sp.]
MRVLLKNGKPTGTIETAVDHFALANGTVWKGNDLYVTDSQWDLPDNDKGSAIMHFTLAELKARHHRPPEAQNQGPARAGHVHDHRERNRRGQRSRWH